MVSKSNTYEYGNLNTFFQGIEHLIVSTDYNLIVDYKCQQSRV